MRASRFKTLIIGLLVLVLTGCSAVRLGYNNGTSLAAWWLDDYLDVTREQDHRLRVALDEWFVWHRVDQLPDYANALREIAKAAPGTVNAGQICAWNEDWRARLDRAVERSLPAAARLLPELNPSQWDYLKRHLAKKNAELRAEYLPADPREREAGAMRRTVERAENLYGALEAPQRQVLQAARVRTPFDVSRWLGERELRQSEWVAGLKALQSVGTTQAQRVDGMRQLFQRTQRSPDPVYREQQATVTAFNCELAAQLHNATNPAQRLHLQQRLNSWQEDLRALAAQTHALSQ